MSKKVKWGIKYLKFGLNFRNSIKKADDHMLKIMEQELKNEKERRNKK